MATQRNPDISTQMGGAHQRLTLLHPGGAKSAISIPHADTSTPRMKTIIIPRVKYISDIHI
jgi:hypothetical protein